MILGGSDRAFAMAVVFVLAFTALAVIPATVAAEDGNIDNVRFHVAGPRVVGIDSTNSYRISLIDESGRDWKYEVWVTAKNKTGAFPTEAEKKTGNLTGGNNSFQVDITSTSNTGTMSIVMNATSPNGAFWYTTEEEITVIEPVVVSATIFNSGQVKINNATVDIYIDGEQIGTDTISSLAPGGKKDVSADWVSDDIAPGWHEARFVVDANGDGVINTDLGDIVFVKDIYVKGSGFATTLILIGILALVIGIMLISHGMRRKKK